MNKLKSSYVSIVNRIVALFVPSLEFLLIGWSKKMERGKWTKIHPPYEIVDVKVGAYTYISKNSKISSCEIGKFCSIGPNFFAGWGIHPTNGISTSPMFYSNRKQNGITLSSSNKILERKKIVIGNDVFIGMNVTILDGVKIGDGAIIGANSLVSKDIPPFFLAAGSPCKLIRKRFEDDIIKELQKIRWWDWKEDRLKQVEQNFFDVKSFINQQNENQSK